MEQNLFLKVHPPPSLYLFNLSYQCFLIHSFMQKGMPTMEAGKEADLWFHIQVLHVIAEKYKDEKLALLYIKDVVLRDSPHTIYPISEKITDVANEFCEACKKEIKEEKEE